MTTSTRLRNTGVSGVVAYVIGPNSSLWPVFDLGFSRIIRSGQWDVGAWGVSRGLQCGWVVGPVLLHPSGRETTGPSVLTPGAKLN